MTRPLILVVGLALGVAAAAARADGPGIDHNPVGCVAIDRFPRFDARLEPADSVARARVFFRAEGGSGWYAVTMTRSGDAFMAFLPKPKKDLRRFSYYVEVADKNLGTSRTAEHTTQVEGGGVTCTPEMMGPGAATAMVLVEAPPGAAAVPAGFSGTGVSSAVASVAVAGAAAGAVGATAATGGGIGTTTVLVGTGVVAAGAGAAVATGAIGGDDEGSNNGTPPPPLIVVRGIVYGRLTVNPANPTGPGLKGPLVAGALVSTSLDSSTAVTGVDGRFLLTTQTRQSTCTPFTLTIVAGGYPTYNVTATFHSGESGADLEFTLSPPGPQPFISNVCQ